MIYGQWVAENNGQSLVGRTTRGGQNYQGWARKTWAKTLTKD